MIRAVPMVAALGACAGDPDPPAPPLHPCHSTTTSVDVAPPRGAFGDLVDGSELWCGHPPQGGAPYSPLRLRVKGPELFSDGIYVQMTAVDVDDGSELAYTDLTMGVTCANVGDSAGQWVGSEAHMRYTGWALDDLAGRKAELMITASSVDGSVVAESVTQVDLIAD